MAKATERKEAVVRVVNNQLAPKVDISPSTFVQDAIAKGAGVEVLEKLLALQERFEANQARKAFDNSMADMREELPSIVKNKRVDYNQTHYAYEDLSSVVEVLAPVLSKHGLSFRWRTESHGDGNVTVTCILSHRDGHYEETALTAAPDNSGQKNAIQALGSAVTYLQRYTLKASIGVASGDDDDGQAPGQRSTQGAGNTGQKQQNNQQAATQQQQPRPDPRTKQPHCQAHTDLGDAIKKYCAERSNTDLLKVLEEVTTVVNGNTIMPGVRDVLYLTEDETKTALGRVKAISAARPPTGQAAPASAAENAKHPKVKALGEVVVGYTKAHAEEFKDKETGEVDMVAANFVVLEDLTGMTNLRTVDSKVLWGTTITPQVAERALEKFDREYNKGK